MDWIDLAQDREEWAAVNTATKCRDVLDQLRNYQLLKKDSAAQSQLVSQLSYGLDDQETGFRFPAAAKPVPLLYVAQTGSDVRPVSVKGSRGLFSSEQGSKKPGDELHLMPR